MSLEQLETGWQERALKAEAALKLARLGNRQSPRRDTILNVLGDLKAGDYMAVDVIARRVGRLVIDTLQDLKRNAGHGWVERKPFEKHSRELSRWRLGYLVMVEDTA